MNEANQGTATVAQFSDISTEDAWLKKRKSKFGDAENAQNWALSLSGGGIRSATFSLGIMQAMARAPLPVEAGPRQKGADHWLQRFDYLSTVSGGGYIGAFFVSLFVPPGSRSEPKPPPSSEPELLDAAKEAYLCLQVEPPRRLVGDNDKAQAGAGQKPARGKRAGALEWLRENGRYLTPNGAGDMGYAISLTLRNLLAVHYVIGTIALSAFLLSQAVAASAYAQACMLPDVLCTLFSHTTLLDYESSQNIVWSASLWWVLTVVALFIVPLIGAFWLCYPERGKSKTEPSGALNQAVFGYAGVIAVATCLYFLWRTSHPTLAVLFAVSAMGCSLSIIGHLLALWFGQRPEPGKARCRPSVVEERVILTRWLSIAFTAGALLAVFALVETTAQTLYLHLQTATGTLSATAAVAAAVMYVVRQVSSLASSKGPGSLLSRLPLDYLLVAAAIVLVLAVALFWAYAAVWLAWANEVPRHWVAWGGEAPSRLGVAQDVCAVWLLSLVAVLLALLTGQFPGFINLSTFAALYGARLTRAYLGASNGKRIAADARADAAAVSEPHKDDDLTLAKYYENRYAPIHLINVCLNQTATSNEHLVQYDRKGMLLTVAPSAYWIDGKEIHRDDSTKKTDESAATSMHVDSTAARGKPASVMARVATAAGKVPAFVKAHLSADIPKQMSVGDWIGTSGAAFGTGMGRGNSLSHSLLFGLANVRTGRWFDLPIADARAASASGTLAEIWRRLVPTQAYLFNELLGRFHGVHRPFAYLSDGGHLDNTGLHALLNPNRRVKFTVLCDNGEDHLYQWDDFANVVRLARIDHGVEIEVEQDALSDAGLKPFLSTPEELSKLPPGESDKCAVLLRVRSPDEVVASAYVLLIKPRLIRSAPIDVHQYKAANPDFPQQSTANQFFDEAQWESYRKLGVAIGERLFGGPGTGASAFALALKRYLQIRIGAT